MKVETVIVMLMFTSLLFGTMFTFMIDIDNEYDDVDVDLSDYNSGDGSQSFSSAFNQINETKAEIDSISEDFEDETVTSDGSLFPFVSLTLKTVKKLFSSLSITKDLITVASNILGIPAGVFATLTSVLIIIMIISVLILVIGRANY